MPGNEAALYFAMMQSFLVFLVNNESVPRAITIDDSTDFGSNLKENGDILLYL